MLLLAAAVLTTIDPELVNIAASNETLRSESRGPAVLRAQILLKRHRFSSGELDGIFGETMARAVRAFRAERALPADESIDPKVWTALETAGQAPVIVQYTITGEDVQGPFPKIPSDMMRKARLDKLGYQSPLEALGEKFHSSPALLKRLNRRSRFRAGDQIHVPGLPEPLTAKAASIIVDESTLSLRALDEAGKTLVYYPTTIGSVHDPLPVGNWKVKGVARNPIFLYNPKLFWDADPSHSKAKIAAGPNNPVGVVWIQLSKEHYGIHGTPDPEQIGKTNSHGCVRLTNWDASELAGMVGPGTPVILTKGEELKPPQQVRKQPAVRSARLKRR